MDPLSAAVNIWTVVSAVKELIDLGFLLKASINKIHTNRRRIQILAKEIIETIHELQNVANQIADNQNELNLDRKASEQLAVSISLLNRELRGLLFRTRVLVERTTSRVGAVDKIKALVTSGSLEEEIRDIRKQVKSCHRHFTTFAIIRIEKAATNKDDNIEIKKKLDLVLEQLQYQFEEAESDATKAQGLIQFRRESCLDLQSARCSAISMLENCALSRAEHRYLSLKIKTIEGALCSTAAEQVTQLLRPPTRLSRTHRRSQSDPTPKSHDAILETLRILKDLHILLSTSQSEITDGLNKLSRSLHDLRMYPDACDISALTLRVHWKLQAQHTQYSTRYAASLDTAYICLDASERYEEALMCAQWAISVRRQLSSRSNDDVRPLLARSLVNAVKCCRELGNRDTEALDYATQAVQIYKELAMEKTTRYTVSYAHTLYNLSSCLSKLGRDKEALMTATRALVLFRRLVAEGRDRDEYLAKAIMFVAQCHSDLGNHDRAVRLAAEGVEIWRELSKASTQHEPKCDQAVNQLTSALSALEISQRSDT